MADPIREPDRNYARKGIALVAVIWAISLLSMILAAFTLTVRSQTYIVRNSVDNAKARAIADAGINMIIGELLNYDSGEPLPVDGTEIVHQYAGASLKTSVQDEAGKFNLNRAQPGQLKGVFLALGLDLIEAEKLAAAIVDYRDRDSLRRLNGAEDDDYKAANATFGAKDGPFETLDELRRVLGMTDELFAASKDAFSVYNRRNRVDRRRAQPLVRSVLEGKTDIFILSDVVIAGQVINNSVKPAPTEAATQKTRQGTVPLRRAGVYTIRTMATLETGALFVRQAVVRLNRNPQRLPFEILEWKQGTLVNSSAD